MAFGSDWEAKDANVYEASDIKKYLDEEWEKMDFEFWAGARDIANILTNEEFDRIEQMITETLDDDVVSEMEINDFFWFKGDTIAEWLGYDDEDALLNRDNEPDDEED
ncbi:unnamed protein product [Cylicocyclus nassatus]|uniref:Uncharacterized protein n=1 Tax=Cylicocyclus nassatus TaxID=53992 RepID=A0AA36HI83_CYLNA|nr:unnamed protein product [Cylicocyclus nassatus]